jgi:TolB-like protein
MVVLVATDLDMSLQFAPGIEILETWGYQHSIEGSRISYKLPGIHLGDYETILVRYRLLPQTGTDTEKDIASFTVHAKNLFEESLPPAEYRIQAALSEQTADGISSGMVLHSGTMLSFAESLKEIGSLYYAGQDDLTALSQLEYRSELSAAEQERVETLKENFFNRLEDALALTRNCRLELENAKLRLSDSEAFNPELEILTKYDEILAKELIDAGGNPAGNYAGLDSQPPQSVSGRPANMDLLQSRLSALYGEIARSFPAASQSIAALAPFGMRGIEEETPLLAFINENALVNLSRVPNIRLVERSRIDAVRAEQNLLRSGLLDTDEAIQAGKLLGAQYMITGQIIPMNAQVIIFARVIHVETGEIVSAAQIVAERETFGDLL